MGGVLATVPRPRGTRKTAGGHAFLALAGSGFRRYATYRQATLASIATNSVFGFLRCFVLLAALAGAGTGAVRDYDAAQLATYCWVSQGLIGVVLLWGWTDLADRIRTGDVAGDLLRPIHPVTAYLAVDLGRAGYAALTRFVVPVAIGALMFDLFVPSRVITYPLFVVSTVLAVVVCFAAPPAGLVGGLAVGGHAVPIDAAGAAGRPRGARVEDVIARLYLTGATSSGGAGSTGRNAPDATLSAPS